MRGSRRRQENLDLNWEEALNNYERVISSGNESMLVKATIKLARHSDYAPEDILAHTVPLISDLLRGNSSDDSHCIQEAAAYCLKCIACRGDGRLAIKIGRSGALLTILRLLPTSDCIFRIVLVKCLWCLLNFGNENRVIVARNGGLGIIINMLNSCVDGTRRYLLEILSALTLLREVRRGLVSVGGLQFLVEAARCGSMISRERACQAIGLIGVTRHVRRMLVELNVIMVLVELFREGDSALKLVAGNSLGVISAHIDYIRLVAQAGAIPLYAELLLGHNHIGKEIAEDVFCLLAVAEENAAVIVEHLAQILQEGDAEAQAAAADVLWGISSYNHSATIIKHSGVIPILVKLLLEQSDDVREKVSGAVAQLSYDKAGREALANCGAMTILVEMLHHESEEIRNNAAEALINFYEDSSQREGISGAVDASLLLDMQVRRAQIRAYDEHMVRSMRRINLGP